MRKEVRSKALSAVMRIFNRAAIQADLEEENPDKKSKKPLKVKKPEADGADLSSIAEGVLSDAS